MSRLKIILLLMLGAFIFLVNPGSIRAQVSNPCNGSKYCLDHCGVTQCNTRLYCDCFCDDWIILGTLCRKYICPSINCQCYAPTVCADGSRICSGSCPTTGGWGGCGSCGSCGGPSNQCVTDPSGNCLWDPGSCSGGSPPCTPNCPNNCGQSNGCNGNCPNTDSGAAGTPVISTPTDGGTATTNANGQITIDWANTARANTYRVEVYNSSNPEVDWTTVSGARSATTGTSNTTRTRAFDISTTTYWASTELGAAVQGAAWIGQDFTRARNIRLIRLKQHPTNPAYRITSAHVQYSDDGTNWATLQTISIPNDGNTNSFEINSTDAHRYWRLLANSRTGTTTNLAWLVYDLEMFGQGEPISPTVVARNTSDYSFAPTSRNYTIRVRALNTTCVAGGQTSEWSNWITFTATSPITGRVYYDGNNTATLTGNTCTGVGASLPATSADITTTANARSNANYSASYPPTRAFDNNNTTYWASRELGAAVNGVSWIGQDFGVNMQTQGAVVCEEDEESPDFDPDCVPSAGTQVNVAAKEIRKLSVRQYTNAINRVSAVYVEHSDDGNSWVTLETVTLAADANTHTYFLTASAPHRFWRLRAASGVAASRVWAVQEIEMFEISAQELGTLTIIGQDYQQYSDQVTVTPEGNYSIFLPYSNTGTNQVTLVIDRASDFICSCPIGCSFSGINAPLTGLDFYITDAREPWFQMQGGSIAAFGREGVVLTDPIPDTCTPPGCKPYVLTRQGGVASSSGLILTGGGDVDLDRETGLQVSNLDEDNTRRIGKVNPRVAQERYEYFYRLYKLSANPSSDFGESAVNAAKPTLAPTNAGTEGYYHGGDVTILNPWTVSSSESMVIFVNGDLNIKSTILVDQGGFLAFIVKGDIIIDPELGHQDPTAPSANDSVVEGVYIANGVFALPSRGASAGGDYKFVGEGTFVGWSGVDLDRNYDDNVTRRVLNNTIPTEVFRYRPDFVIRTPDKMRVPRIVWREVAP